MSTETGGRGQCSGIELVIPSGVEMLLEGKKVTMKGELGTLSEDFSGSKVQLMVDGNILKATTQKKGKRGDALLGTVSKRVKNLIRGVNERYVVKMKVVHSHFPTTVKKDGKTLRIENFMGERSPRRIAIPDGVEVNVTGVDLLIKGIDKDRVTQLAGSIQSTTRILRKDPRVYLDGIYVVEKGYEGEIRGA